MKYMPTWYCQNIYKLDIESLKRENIKYILTDLDNTLAPYDIPTPSEETIKLVKSIQDAGLKIIIISNNTGKRVNLFATDLGIDYISGAKKPFTFVIKRRLKEKNIDINDCVIIGDQVMTDIKCANRLGCRCILTHPLVERESIFTFFNRRIDRYYRKKYNYAIKCNKLDRSEE